MAGVFSPLAADLSDRYLIERELGRGGMATVYLARDLKHKRPVAFKVLHAELSQVLGAERFHREIEFAARLQHPHILGVYDSGESAGRLWFTMPYVKGESLRDRLGKEKRLPIDEALRITREAAQALTYAHKEGVVHRDIKPENILLTEDGSTLIADFGIARALEATQEGHLTETGVAVGTPAYMAPEQALGDHQLDARADQYSLAAVCYEMLAGEPPFTGPTPAAIIAARYKARTPSARARRPEVSVAVDRALQRALELDPERRFESIYRFCQALTEGAAESAHRRELKHVLRPSRSVIGLVLGLLLGAGILFGWKQAQQPDAVTEMNPRPADHAGSALDPRRIAVLYFRTIPGQDSLVPIADGLSEALIHELSRVSSLQTVSASGVAPFRQTRVPPDSIARALRVGTMVDGVVEQSGERLRVSVSLVDPKTSTEMGNKTVERPRNDIFALQDDVAEEVSIFLRERLGQYVELQQSREGTASSGAWEVFQQAEKLTKDFDQLLNAGDSSAAKLLLGRADSLFTRAHAIDPKWVQPPIKRGWLAFRQTDLVGEFDKTLYEKWLRLGLRHAELALELSPEESAALELRGVLRYWRWMLNLEPGETAAANLLTSAERDLTKAVEKNPSAAVAWTYLSHMLMGQSRPAEAKIAALRAYQADPYLASVRQTLWRLFQSSLDLQDNVEARHWCAEGHRRFAGYYRFTECQLWLFALPGEPADIPRAWSIFAEYVRLSPPPQRLYNQLYGQMLVAVALARAGLSDSASSLATRSRGDAKVDPTRDLALLEAIVHTLRGDRDEAFRRLSMYVAVNPQLRRAMARDETWWFSDLRQDRRYRLLFGDAR